MAILDVRLLKVNKIKVDLTGEQGNAHYLLCLADLLCKKLDLDADKIQDEMMDSDYENLIQVFDKYFGDLVDLYK
jgi:hypothetical protein